jgi:hypothetical protein
MATVLDIAVGELPQLFCVHFITLSVSNCAVVNLGPSYTMFVLACAFEGSDSYCGGSENERRRKTKLKDTFSQTFTSAAVKAVGWLLLFSDNSNGPQEQVRMLIERSNCC